MTNTEQWIASEVSSDRLRTYQFDDESNITKTSMDQKECEQSCLLFFHPFETLPIDQQYELQTKGFLDKDLKAKLLRDKHVEFLKRGLSHLSGGFFTLDASRPWLCYWMLHGLQLLETPPTEIYDRIIKTFQHFWHSDGGFGGGPMQVGHTATTYAACLSLAIIGTPEALNAVDRSSLHAFFLKRKHSSGAFSAHEGGEVDVRVTYCVISIASLYGILSDDITKNVVEYVISCQTYEGGFGGEPHSEAHGGYAYCSIATLWILNALNRVRNFKNLLHWIVNRQMRFEGGYQGRTNKLVDGCYSFWQGAIPALLAPLLKETYGLDHFQCHQLQLQKYILLCGQQLEGGLRDKPGKPRDHYHTCYCLSGLSIAQHGDILQERGSEPIVYGSSSNLLPPVHPAYNIGMDKVKFVQQYFAEKRK
uniref:Protein farnesyltransferase subunit beta n=1 Tax=Albugo laibachii Nc14 TaxID=890382 RepID=F0WVW7_9STRA|nr:prenyltransferaselike protein putative [Albugo laibachii Nc14]|eukprot:CCA25568.1 prenyltransferaselike protein putative [Albugo laibachii Nc14]